MCNEHLGVGGSISVASLFCFPPRACFSEKFAPDELGVSLFRFDDI